jgi:translation initiation factor 2 subunit 1
MTSLKPMPGILAVAEITEIHTNSISSKLLEYDRIAFLNIANIPGLWIRDLKKFMKKGDLIVAKIIKVNGEIELSMKDVSKYDAEKKLQYFRKENKSVRMFKTVSKEFGIDDNEVDEAISKLKDEFGSVYESLKQMRDGEIEVVLKDEFKLVINRFSTGEKTYEFKGELELHSDKGNGVECIKKAMIELGDDIEPTYIGNTTFLIKLYTKDPKRGEKELEKKALLAVKKMQSLGGRGEFKKEK